MAPPKQKNLATLLIDTYTEVIAINYSNTSVIHNTPIMYMHRCMCISTLNAAPQRTHHKSYIMQKCFHRSIYPVINKHKYIIHNEHVRCMIRHIAHTSTCSNNSNDAVLNVFVVDPRFSRSYRRCDGTVRIYSETSAGNRTSEELHSGRG